MFGRRSKAPDGKGSGQTSATAREALQDKDFGNGVTCDYDPAVWARMPREGEDRTEWAARHTAAFASDLALPDGDPVLDVARTAFDEAADRLLTHTVDVLAVPQPAAGIGAIVGYVDVVDTELGLLEHANPDVFLRFDDIAPEARVEISVFPTKRDPEAFRYSVLGDPTTGQRFLRAHRQVGADRHLYAMAIHSTPKNVDHVLRLVRRTQVRTTA